MNTRIAPTLSVRDRIDIALHEYSALYSLVTFRMASLDRRAPLEGATLIAFLGAVAVVPKTAQLVLLAAVPLALVWLLRTTVNHVRSFEDALSRLAEIEQMINEMAAQDLLVFQSRHPSRLAPVGGRTGRETVLSVYSMCLLILAGCALLAHDWAAGFEWPFVAYGVALLIEAGYLTRCVWELRAYEYRRSPALESLARG